MAGCRAKRYRLGHVSILARSRLPFAETTCVPITSLPSPAKNMAQQHNDTVARIRTSFAEARALQEDAVMFDASATEARLEHTIRELQARVEEQQSALDHVRSKQ